MSEIVNSFLLGKDFLFEILLGLVNLFAFLSPFLLFSLFLAILLGVLSFLLFSLRSFLGYDVDNKQEEE